MYKVLAPFLYISCGPTLDNPIQQKSLIISELVADQFPATIPILE